MVSPATKEVDSPALEETKESWKAHWKCFVACGVVVLSPFQYGVDFGLIGGLQAMVGFLKVSRTKSSPLTWTSLTLT